MRAAKSPAPKPAKKPRRKPPLAAVPDPPDKASSYARNRAGAAALGALDLGPFRPAREQLRRVQAVPSIFLGVDVALGVMGLPVGRTILVFGPSHEGKTELAVGACCSFVRLGHPVGYLDAERTTVESEPWVRTLMGAEADSPLFTIAPVSTYEKVVDGVRRFCEGVSLARSAGQLPPDAAGLVVVDSIRKLVPADLVKKIAQAAESDGEKKRRGARKGIDGLGGRAAQHKAALNAAWMDELTPLLADTRCSILIIAREDLDPDDVYADRPKIGGGRALFYESSLALRTTKEPVWDGPDGAKRVVGERHLVEVYKSKLAGKREKRPSGAYHTSNGLGAPEGFWPARDALEVGLELGVVEQAGSWYRFAGARIGNGAAGVLKRLAEEPELVERISVACRAAASPAASSSS